MTGFGFHFIINYGLILLIYAEDFKLNPVLSLKIFNSTGYQATTEPVFTAISAMLLAYSMLSKKENRSV